jgi:Bardet-Biedl syndrome 9 protein
MKLNLDFPVEDSMSNVMALKHLDGTIVSLLVSKTTNKYRLQSDSLAALALLVNDLQRRLHLYFCDAKNLQVNLDSPLPIQEIWNQVESHFTCYTELKKELVKKHNALQYIRIHD